MRADPNRVVKWVPSQNVITAARLESEKMLRYVLLHPAILFSRVLAFSLSRITLLTFPLVRATHMFII